MMLIYQALKTIITEVRQMVQQITDLQTSLNKLEADVATLAGKVLGADDLTALTTMKATVDALDAKIAPTT